MAMRHSLTQNRFQLFQKDFMVGLMVELLSEVCFIFLQSPVCDLSIWHLKMNKARGTKTFGWVGETYISEIIYYLICLLTSINVSSLIVNIRLLIMILPNL